MITFQEKHKDLKIKTFYMWESLVVKLIDQKDFQLIK